MRTICGAILLGALLVGIPSAAPPPASAAVAGPFYVSPSGRDTSTGTKTHPWKTIQHAADRLRAGQTVFIRGGTYRERVRPKYSGTAGHLISYRGYPGEVPTIDGLRITLPADQAGLFEIAGRAYIRVSGLRIINARPDVNSNGILVIGSHDILLEGNRTYNTKSSGIGIWRSRKVTVRGNEIAKACNGGHQESLTIAGTDTFVVEKNTVRDTGADKEGIDAKDGSRNGKIRGNLVHHVPAVGIYVDAWDKPTSNIEVSGNTVHHAGNGIALASEAGGLLSNIRVVNNVVYDSTWLGIAVTRNGDGAHPMDGITIMNNTVWRNGDTWGGGLGVDDPNALHVVVRNNIVSANRSFQLSLSADVPAANVSIDHNLIHGYRGDFEDGEIYGDAPVVGDPLFASAAAGDFHVRSGSPAIDAGSVTGAPATDFAGVARPRGAGYDIGAFEH